MSLARILLCATKYICLHYLLPVLLDSCVRAFLNQIKLTSSPRDEIPVLYCTSGELTTSLRPHLLTFTSDASCATTISSHYCSANSLPLHQRS